MAEFLNYKQKYLVFIVIHGLTTGKKLKKIATNRSMTDIDDSIHLDRYVAIKRGKC